MKRLSFFLTFVYVLTCACLSRPAYCVAQAAQIQRQTGAYESGMELVRRGRPEEALRIFGEGLQADPHNVLLLNAAGSVSMLLNRPEKATSYFRQAIDLQPHFIPARKNLGIALWRLGKVEASREQFEFVLQESGQDTTSELFLGLITSKAREFEKAIRYLNRLPPAVLESRPEAVLALTQSYLECGRIEEGLASLRRLSQLPSLPPQMNLLAGELAFQHGAYAEALNFLSVASVDPSRSAEISYKLALANYKLGYYPQALEVIEAAAKNGVQTGDLYNLQAWVEEKLGRTEAAIKALRGAIELEPAREEHYLDLSTICLDHAGNDDLAGAIVDVGLQKMPHSYRLLVQRGVIYEKRGRHAEALRCFESALTLQPSDSVALLSLGISHWQANELPRAVAVFSEGTRRFPADFRFFYFYGLASEKLIQASAVDAPKAFEPASKALRRSILLNPEFPESHFVLGKILARTGHAKEAEQEFGRTLSLNPGHVEAKYWLSRIYRQLGRDADAARLEREVQEARQKRLQEESQMRIVLVRK